MLFNETLIQKAQTNPIQSVIEICDIVYDSTEHSSSHDYDYDYDCYLEAWALISELVSAGLLDISGVKLPYPNPSGLMAEDMQLITNWLKQIKSVCATRATLIKAESFKNKFRITFSNSFHYEFSQGDLDRVQSLINELRKHVAESKLADEHKQRLLARLEKMQTELHKKVSDLDRFWGLIGDASVALGKLGEGAKPIVDRIRELTEIAWNTQSKAEELPSGTSPPLLENKPETGQGQIEA